MAGANNSGMDILFEVSAHYIEQMIRRKFADMGRICINQEEMDLDLGALVDVRRVVPAIESVLLSETRVDGNPVAWITVQFDLLYGRYRLHAEDEEPIDSPNEEGWSDIPIQPDPIVARVTTWPEAQRILLIAETETFPAWIPERWLDALGSPADIPERPDGRLLAAVPLDFLDQTDGDSALLTTLVDAALLRIVNGNLVVGVGISWAQDEDPHITTPDDRRVPHRCGLPDNTVVDVAEFLDNYAGSIVAHYDWGIAFDSRVVEAVLRGLPSAGMIDADAESCDDKGSLRAVCLRRVELRDDVAVIEGSAEAYVCPDEFFVANGYYAADFEAEVRLTISGQPARLRGAYEIVAASLQDGVQDCLVDALEKIPESTRSGSIRLRAIPTSFGEPEGPAGRLTAYEVVVIPEAVILRGLGSVRPNEPPRMVVPDELLFAAGCPDLRTRARFSIRNLGIARLHLCPLVIRPVAGGDIEESGRFRVVSPASLRADGGGRSLDHRDSVEVTLELDGDAGNRYEARLDIPNNVATQSILLTGDLRPAEVGPLPDEIVMERTDFSLCNRGFPVARPILRGIHISNQGEGNMQVCSVGFLPDNPDGVFSAELPGVFAREGIVRFTFSPGEAGVNRDYACTARIETNGGSGDVELRARLERREDGGFGAMSGSFSDAFCGETDWNAARGADGFLMHPPELNDVLTLLGGSDCCPPPRGPACLCVDVLSLWMRDVPRNAVIELLRQDGVAAAESMGVARDRALIAPFRGLGAYALRARLPAAMTTSRRASPFQMRRTLWQQDGFYECSSTLRGVAVAGNHAYAVAADGLHVLRLDDVMRPARAALVTELAGATAADASGGHLALLQDGLQLYDLSNPVRPMRTGGLSLDSTLTSMLCFGRWCAVAGASRLFIMDLADRAAPKQVASVPVTIQARAMALRGKLLLVAGAGGVHCFDVSRPHRPAHVSAFANDATIINLIGLGPFQTAIRDDGTAELWHLRRAARPQQVGAWRFESWFVPFVPPAGGTVRYRDHWLFLTHDRKGIRFMRARSNAVNRKALLERRSRRDSRHDVQAM